MTWLSSGEFYAILCASMWAVAFVLFCKANAIIPPVVLNLFKNTVGLGCLLLTMLVLGIPLFPPERSVTEWGVVLLSGFIGIAMADTLLFYSLKRLGAGLAAIVGFIYSPFVALVAFFYLGERVGPELLWAALLIGGGIVLGTWQRTDKHRLTVRAPGLWLAIGAGLMASFLMAVGIVIVKPVILVADAWWVAAVRLAAAIPALALLGCHPRWRTSTRFAFTPGRHWALLMPAAVIGAYFALILWILGFKYTLAANASLLNQTSAIMVLLLATLFLGEPLHWRKWAALACGFSGVAIVVLW